MAIRTKSSGVKKGDRVTIHGKEYEFNQKAAGDYNAWLRGEFPGRTITLVRSGGLPGKALSPQIILNALEGKLETMHR